MNSFIENGRDILQGLQLIKSQIKLKVDNASVSSAYNEINRSIKRSLKQAGVAFLPHACGRNVTCMFKTVIANSYVLVTCMSHVCEQHWTACDMYGQVPTKNTHHLGTQNNWYS